jgi:uncharacterized protein YcbK (DUF882 family)
MTEPRLGPSAHLSWRELACKDGTAYPREWRDDRAVVLAVTFEDVRALLGDRPLTVNSGYRTPAYNARLEGSAVKSQHVEGRAIDFTHPTLTPRQVFSAIRAAQRRGELPLLGGLGFYRGFVHFDVRPRSRPGYLATWAGKGLTVPV